MWHPGAVGILAIDDEHVWLTRQPREAVGAPASLEIPAGKLDVPGSSPLETGKRELAEEIGKQAASWEELFAFYTSPGFSDERVWLYLATGLSDSGPAEADEDERIEIVPWPLIAPGRRDRRVRGLQVADRAALARRPQSRRDRVSRSQRQGSAPPIPFASSLHLLLLTGGPALARLLVGLLVAARNFLLDLVERRLRRRAPRTRATWFGHLRPPLHRSLGNEPRENARARHSEVDVHQSVYAPGRQLWVSSPKPGHPRNATPAHRPHLADQTRSNAA